MELTKEQKVVQQVITEAWSNPSFKKELIANPTNAIKRLTGQTLAVPAGKTLAVYDQSNPDVVCLNIPPQPDTDNMQLTDKQLEIVAGGGCIPADGKYITMIWPPYGGSGGCWTPPYVDSKPINY